MVSSGSHYLRVWDVDDNSVVRNPDNPLWTVVAIRSGGSNTESIETHLSAETTDQEFVVTYNAGYYVTMAAEIRFAGTYDWELHTISAVRHERQIGVTVLTLEVRRGVAGYEERAFSDGFSDGFA